MKNIPISVITVLTVLNLFYGCRKKEMLPQEEIPSIPHDSQMVHISFPEGMNVNYTDYSLFSLADNSKLDAAGSASISYNQGSTNIAWLFDKENNLVMAGFVNDTAKTISAATTAKVLLYYAYAIPLMSEDVINEYLNKIETKAGYSNWVQGFSALLKNDRLVVSKNGYLTLLKNTIQEIVESNTTNVSSSQEPGNLDLIMSAGKQSLNPVAIKPADINVITGDVKSGIQLVSENLSKVGITNFYRRRAHAFFYKTKFKDINGMEKGVISEITETTPSDKNESITPTSSANSATAILGNLIEGKLMDFAENKGGPYDFPLQDNETEATYKVRVVGPGQKTTTTLLTKAESDKLFRLQVETVAFDFLVPLFASKISSKLNFEPGPNATAAEKETIQLHLEGFIKLVEEMIKGAPGVYDAINKGNYKEAVEKILEAVYAGNISAVKEGYVKMMALIARMAVEQKFYVSPHFDELESANRWNRILKAVDGAMEAGDFVNLIRHLADSKTFEEWTLQLSGGKVTLQFLPGYDSLINTSEETKIKAEIKNMAESGGEQHPFFEWSTTGKYGKLVDTKGHSGTSFATSDHIVSYQSTTNSSDIKEGDNIDHIFVKALFNNVVIGMDTIAVNVKKVGYEILPRNATVTGKKHAEAGNSITLNLAKVVTGIRDIPNHQSFDFKIEWSTPGNYGQLIGATTNYNDDDIVYKATNDQEGIFSETINARIYARNKGEADYWLYENVKGAVKIDNDPKKKIYHRPLQIFHGDTTYPWRYCRSCPMSTLSTCWKSVGAKVDKEENAVSYLVTFKEASPLIGAPSGYSWTANGGGQPPLPPPAYAGGHIPNAWVAQRSISTSNSVDGSGHVPGNTATGYLEIIVTLK